MKMKKRAGFCFAIIIWIVSVCLWVSSERIEGGDNTVEEKVVKETEDASMIEKKQYKKEYNGEEYIVYLYDEWGKEVDRMAFLKEPGVCEIGEDILEVSISFGSPVRYDVYFHKKTLQQSQAYFNSMPLSEKYVSYVDDNKLIVHDIFLEGILYEEIIRDFVGYTPISDIYIFSSSNRKALIFEYYNKKEGETVTEAVEIFPKDK